MKKRRLDPAAFDIEALSRASSGYSGAEIEEAIISAMFDMFYDKHNMTTEFILESVNQTVPLSRTMSEDVDKLRKWAEGRARTATSADRAKERDADKRKLEL